MTDSPTFASTELTQLWPYVERTLENMVAIANDCSVEERNWRPPAPETNSIEALHAHTLGNARMNVLGVLCGLDHDRDREAEFQAIASEATADPWPAVRDELRAALAALPADAMDRVVTHPVRGEVTGRQLLMILARHASEHVGHAGLTRDLAKDAG